MVREGGGEGGGVCTLDTGEKCVALESGNFLAGDGSQRVAGVDVLGAREREERSQYRTTQRSLIALRLLSEARAPLGTFA